MYKRLTILLVVLSILSSCVPVNRMAYVQSNEDLDKTGEEQVYFIGETEEALISPDDELFIRISSADEDPNGLTSQESSVNEPNLLSYSVDKDGYILLPLLGKTKVGDMTVEQASDSLENLFKQYLYLPSVYIKIINKKVTILGEVANPGVYFFYNKNISILQAIGYANDITTYGDRKKVMILRENGNEIKKTYVDLTSDDLLTSAYYYVSPNDIIYISPLERKKWGLNNTVPFNLVLGLVSTTLLILTYSNTMSNAN